MKCYNVVRHIMFGTNFESYMLSKFQTQKCAYVLTVSVK